MALRTLLRYLMHNEHLIQKISESYPVRRAAQLTAYMFHRGKEMGEDGIERASRFSDTFSKEVQQGFKDINDKVKKDR